MSSYEVLHHLEETTGGRMRMCELAEQAQLSRSGLTRLIDRMERDGLVERCSCDHDARGSYACLTGVGRERLQEARGTHLAVIRDQFFSHFSEVELSTLADMWNASPPAAPADGPSSAYSSGSRSRASALLSAAASSAGGCGRWAAWRRCRTTALTIARTTAIRP